MSALVLDTNVWLSVCSTSSVSSVTAQSASSFARRLHRTVSARTWLGRAQRHKALRVSRVLVASSGPIPTTNSSSETCAHSKRCPKNERCRAVRIAASTVHSMRVVGSAATRCASTPNGTAVGTAHLHARRSPESRAARRAAIFHFYCDGAAHSESVQWRAQRSDIDMRIIQFETFKRARKCIFQFCRNILCLYRVSGPYPGV